ncbi:MAG: tripartite tricarboxylate transporter substrate binding protein [Alcaligenaceae bacterium]|nr:tripartite tricarboxylate transporter substrate binding protein [Alcaligenaceae bacterium]
MKAIFPSQMIKKILAVTAIATAFSAFSSVHTPLQAQTEQQWPTKEIRLIVPFGPGSTPDQIARVVAAEASKTLNQSIVIENRSGAGGNIGTAAIARAKPDGYTFGISINGPLVYNQFLYKNLNFDPNKDLYPLTLAVTQPNVIAVSTESGIESLEELAEAIKKNPDSMNFAIPGTGSGSHLTQELFLQAIHGEAMAIPYNSSPQALNSLVAGDTQFTALAPIALVPLATEGRLKLLAQTGAERIEALADVPTIKESGVADIVGAAWSGFVISNKVPQAIKKQLQEALFEALQQPAVVETLRAQYMEPTPSTPEEFKAYMQEEKQRWEPLIKSLDLEL